MTQQPQILEGRNDAKGLRIAIVAAQFNDAIVNNLVDGALAAIRRHNGNLGDCDLVRVPGAFEVPATAQRLAKSSQYHAIICLGAVIRGSTPHFDYVAGIAAKGVNQVALESGIPCIFGVLTTDTIEQALERAGTKMGNKGYDAAVAAIEMATLFQEI